MHSAGMIIVTGAAGGLGKAIAKEFANDRHSHLHAIFTVRNSGVGNVDELKQIIQDDKSCHIRPLKLDNLQCVREFAKDVNLRVCSGRLPPIIALCFNAGYMSSHGLSFTDDGYEKAFQINYLANFLLAHLLLPSIDRTRGRIVFVTSFSHDPAGKHARLLPLPKELFGSAERIAKPPPDNEDRHTAGFRRYAQSKMCAMMLMHGLQNRMNTRKELAKIVVMAVDPGLVASTNIMREQHFLNRLIVERIIGFLTPLLQRLSRNGLYRTRTRSARDILNACIGQEGPTASEQAKAMVANGPKLQKSSLESRDIAKQNLLWKGSLKLAGLLGEENSMLEDLPPRISEQVFGQGTVERLN